jgi:hypothetical protein
MKLRMRDSSPRCIPPEHPVAGSLDHLAHRADQRCRHVEVLERGAEVTDQRVEVVYAPS